MSFAAPGDSFTFVRWEMSDGALFGVIDRGGDRERVPYDELIEECQLRIAPQGEVFLRDLTRDARFAQLDERRRVDLRQRVADLLEVRHGDPGGLIDAPRPGHVPRPEYDPAVTTLHDRIQAKVLETKDRPNGQRMTVSTAYRQLGTLANEGMVGLVHGSTLKRLDRVAAIDPRIPQIASALVADLRRDCRSTTAATTRMTMFRARLRLAEVPTAGVSEAVLRSVLSFAEAGSGVEKPASVRRSQAGRPKGQQRRYEVSRPGELVQIDATTLDAYAWSPVCGSIAVDVITAIDAFDRRVLVCMCVPAPHTARDVSIAMGRMLTVGEAYPWRRYDDRWWPGVPEEVAVPAGLPPTNMDGTVVQLRRVDTVTMDHGSQFDSQILSSVAARAGISTIFAAPRRGSNKGIVEAFHNQVSRWTEELPGAKGGRPRHRGVNVEDEALFTIAELEAALNARISLLYHNTPHDGLRDPANPRRRMSPNEAYSLYLASGGVPCILANPHAPLDFFPSVRRRADDRGVDLNGLRYDGPGLAGLRDGERGRNAPDLLVRFDPYEPTRIYVQHPDTHQDLTVFEFGVQSGLEVPLGTARLAAARRRESVGETLRPAESSVAAARILADEMQDVARKTRRKTALSLERLLLADRDRLALGIALWAPDPELDSSVDEPTFYDPGTETRIPDRAREPLDDDLNKDVEVFSWN